MARRLKPNLDMDIPDSYIEMHFPLGGVDVSDAFDQQRAGTTPVAFNVRAFEPSSYRGRGGSREGLSRYLGTQLGGPIQSLSLVVNTDPTYTLDQFDADDFGFPIYPIHPFGGIFGPAFPFAPRTTFTGGLPSDPFEDPSTDGFGNPMDGSGGNFGRNPRRSTGKRRQVRNKGSGRQQVRRPTATIDIWIKPNFPSRATPGPEVVPVGDEWVLLHGAEFPSGVYVSGDITHVSFTSEGFKQSVVTPDLPPGLYPVIASGATGPNVGRYNVHYVPGTILVVGS